MLLRLVKVLLEEVGDIAHIIASDTTVLSIHSLLVSREAGRRTCRAP